LRGDATAVGDLEQIRSSTPLPETQGDLRPSHLTLAVFGLSRRKSIYFTILEPLGPSLRHARQATFFRAGRRHPGRRIAGFSRSLRRVSPLQFRQFIRFNPPVGCWQTNASQLWRIDFSVGWKNRFTTSPFFRIFKLNRLTTASKKTLPPSRQTLKPQR
jgi:hypothetical protein